MSLHVKNETNQPLQVELGKSVGQDNSSPSTVLQVNQEKLVISSCQDSSCGTLMFSVWIDNKPKWKGYVPIGNEQVVISKKPDITVTYGNIKIPNIINEIKECKDRPLGMIFWSVLVLTVFIAAVLLWVIFT